ncbi:MAG: hypothetical protein K2X82_06805 [Gemmataceae bacterium]|nr:hypothetical protein [Gemmataceae bacterium]
MALMAGLFGVLAVKAAWWWVEVSDGRTDPGSMTTWQWVRVVFWHVAVVVGAAGVVGMVRERRAGPPPDSPSPPQPSL